MTQTKDHCYVCGTPPRVEDPSIPEEYYRGLWCHSSCLNSPEGIAWRRGRTQWDPGFARYLRLSSVGLRMPCPSCGQVCSISAFHYAYVASQDAVPG